MIISISNAAVQDVLNTDDIGETQQTLDPSYFIESQILLPRSTKRQQKMDVPIKIPSQSNNLAPFF